MLDVRIECPPFILSRRDQLLPMALRSFTASRAGKTEEGEGVLIERFQGESCGRWFVVRKAPCSKRWTTGAYL